MLSLVLVAALPCALNAQDVLPAVRFADDPGNYYVHGGNSKFYGYPLPSDEILAAIFGHFGFRLDRIDRMRRRQSKTGLYEAVVFMERE